MPLYSEHISNMYYGGSPSYSSGSYNYNKVTPLGSSYSASYLNPGGSYSTHSSLGGYSRVPITPRWTSSSGRNYSPILSTISERSISSPARISSPRRLAISKRTFTPPSYNPRPININTSDIDVSRDRYRPKSLEKSPPLVQKTDDIKVESDIVQLESDKSSSSNDASPFMPRVDGKPETGIDSSPGIQRSTIKRGRTVVRLHTIKRKEKDSPRQPSKDSSPENISGTTGENVDESEETLGWREKLSEELVYVDKREKKTIGEKLVEKFTVKHKDEDDSDIERFSPKKSFNTEILQTPQTATVSTTYRSPDRRCSMELLAEQANVLDTLIRGENLSTDSLDLSKVGVSENTQKQNDSVKRLKTRDQSNSIKSTKSDHSLYDRLNSNQEVVDLRKRSKKRSLRKSLSGGNICRLDSITEFPKEGSINLTFADNSNVKLLPQSPTSKLRTKITSSVEVSTPVSPLKLIVEDVIVEEKTCLPKKDVIFSSVVDAPQPIDNDMFANKPKKIKTRYSTKRITKTLSQDIDSISPEPDDGNFWDKIGKRETVYLLKRKQNLEEHKEKQKRALCWYPEDEDSCINEEIETIENSELQKETLNNTLDVTDLMLKVEESLNKDLISHEQEEEVKREENVLTKPQEKYIEKTVENKLTEPAKEITSEIVTNEENATLEEPIVVVNKLEITTDQTSETEVKQNSEIITVEVTKDINFKLKTEETPIESVKHAEIASCVREKIEKKKEVAEVTSSESTKKSLPKKGKLQNIKDTSKTNQIQTKHLLTDGKKKEIKTAKILPLNKKSNLKESNNDCKCKTATNKINETQIKDQVANQNESQIVLQKTEKSPKTPLTITENPIPVKTNKDASKSSIVPKKSKTPVKEKQVEMSDGSINSVEINITDNIPPPSTSHDVDVQKCDDAVEQNNAQEDNLTNMCKPDSQIQNIEKKAETENIPKLEEIVVDPASNQLNKAGEDEKADDKVEIKKEPQNEVHKFGPRKPVKNEPAVRPLIATPRPLQKKVPQVIQSSSSSDSSSSDESSDSEEADASDGSESSTEFFECETNTDGRTSTGSNDSGFDSSAPTSPAGFLHAKKDCDVNCHRKCEKLTANLCGVNQKLLVEALATRTASKRGGETPGSSGATAPAHASAADVVEQELEQSTAYCLFRKTGRFTPPARTIPRFRKYGIEDFQFVKVLGKGSFGKVLLAELRETEYYYAVKCLKKDVVLEDDDVECTLIERKVLALGTNHPYLCHLFATFQTDSHLFFVMEYLNGGDLMFHIQQSGRFPESRARFYAAEIVSGLKFLHKRGIVYRDLKLDNILLDFDGHVRIADFGMCKLQIYLDKTADTFCGTPDYMAPEIIKGLKYNQTVDWWSFGVLLYEMLIGQSPFSGCDEDELFWSICNEIPSYPRFLSHESLTILTRLLDKDARTRMGGTECMHGDIRDQDFFHSVPWDRLERRELEAPFKPRVRHPLDTQYFDRAFTGERPRLTAVDVHVLRSMDQEPFRGFSYTNPNATDR